MPPVESEVYQRALYWVFVALLEKRGDTWLVLDRQEVTGDLALFTDAVSADGKLVRMLTLNSTSAQGRSGQDGSSKL